MIIGFPNRPAKQGGPGSFQIRLETALNKKGWRIVYPEDDVQPDLVLVFGGTSQIKWLFSLKKNKIPIVFRLGGINWLIKNKSIPEITKLKIYWKLKFTPYFQRIFAKGIIYQSNFAKTWLLNKKQSARIKNHRIIFNGVDVELFKPIKNVDQENISLLCVEGNIDYSPYAIELLNILQEKLIERSNYKSLIVYGGFEDPESKDKLSKNIDYRGVAAREDMPGIYQNATFLSLDINATCPNTVIEAMASGLPIIGFDTGALKELVQQDSGILTPFGSDPWKLGFPDADALIRDAKNILENWKYFAKKSRENAVKNFDFNKTVEEYISYFSRHLD